MNLDKRFPRYTRLLKLYPAAYRKQYGLQMQQTLADMLDDPDRAKVGVWARTIIDLPVSVAQQQCIYFGGIMTHEMPAYVKRNALVSGALLLPFTTIFIVNGVDKIINDHQLDGSWLWHMPILAIWMLWLPLAAAIIASVSLIVFLAQRSKAQRVSWFKVSFDVSYTWPLLAVSLVGLSIVAMVFDHDSVHCVTGNPAREARNLHQTWQCIQQR
jgi:hypothetical protein